VSEDKNSLSSIEVAKQLAERLESLGREYALGGAIALGYWGLPRGTVDVDITLFLPPEELAESVEVLRTIGCEFSTTSAMQSLGEHGFCRVTYAGTNVDIFLPIVPFYEAARSRRRSVALGDRQVAIWDAETLAVFKMMFFRQKDLADIEQILRTQGKDFDASWVREQLAEMYGKRDPRLSTWDEIAEKIRPGE
jgi:hypothetical protein